MLHVDTPSRTEIEKLVAARADLCVTIYVKMTPFTQEIGASSIAFKNLCHQAGVQLETGGVGTHDAAAIDEALADILDDDTFWDTQANSLAMFASPQGAVTYRLANHIPDQIHASDRFHIQPLLRAVTFPNNAFILVLGENGVALH